MLRPSEESSRERGSGPRVLTACLVLVAAACTSQAIDETAPPAVATSPAPVSSTVGEHQHPTTVARGDWYLVWTSARLPDGFASALRGVPGIEDVSVVRVGNAPMIEVRDASGGVTDLAPDGFWYPLDMHWIDPAAHADFVPPEVAANLAALDADEVLLGESSSELRGIGAGATIRLSDGTALDVAGVVADQWVGAAELVTTSPDGASLGAELPRYAIVKYSDGQATLESTLLEITDEPVRVRSEDEIPVFRHADAVRSQVDIKKRFGEFALRPGEGRAIEIESPWVDENIVTTDLPLLGTVSCHRDFARLLAQVMRELEVEGLGHLIDPGAFLGCWNSRFISGRRDLSRHAWGVAADINFGNPQGGSGSPTAPELLEAMMRAGITSGKDWLRPDPGHFEWYGTDS